VDEDEGRALLAAYLPASEPAESPVSEVVTRARAIRRRRWAVLAGAASVAAVLLVSAIATAVQPSAGPPARPAPSPSAPATPSLPPCHGVVSDAKDAGARAWGRWINGKFGRQSPGAAWFGRTCAEWKDSVLVPTRSFNRVELGLGSSLQMLTAYAIRRAQPVGPDWQPCQDNEWIRHVACHSSTLPDGSLLVRDDHYEINVRGGGTAVRYVGRIFPDGRSIGIYLNRTGGGGAHRELVRSQAELAAIVTDPQVLRYFPRP
jgi:hypothetical protein